MHNSRAIIICSILTLFLSVPSLIKIPQMRPFLGMEARTKAPLAIEELRKQGIWVVNTELQSIEKQGGNTCFHFEHSYRSRGAVADPEKITICL